MIVASRLPSRNAFIASMVDSAGRPASRATDEPATGAPRVPWHIAQFTAIDATPCAVTLGAANAGVGGAGCCASAAAEKASAAAIDAVRFFIGPPFHGGYPQNKTPAAERASCVPAGLRPARPAREAAA